MLAGIINGLKVTGKTKEECKVIINGAGSAGVAITKLLLTYGFKNVTMCDKSGILSKKSEGLNWMQESMMEVTNLEEKTGSLADALVGADVFVGVSAPNIVTADMVKTMNKDAIIFAMANPVPEIMPDIAKAAGARVVGTGRSDFPNQVNNVIAFPGIFKGALGSQAQIITRHGNNVASNRNNILNYFENGAKIILLDDDIRDFRKWEEKQGNKCGTQKKITELDKTFNEVFSFMQKNNIHFMGCLPTTNNMNIATMLRKGETYSFNTLVQGGLCFVIKSEEIKFDEKWDMLEDYELNLRMIRQGYIIARVNNIVPNKSYMGKEKAGQRHEGYTTCRDGNP